MKIIRLLVLMLLITFTLGLVQPAQAAPPSAPFLDDDVCFGGTRTYSAGTEVNGNLVAFGCSIVVEEGVTINGDVVVFGGTISIDGEITGELVAMGAAVTLDENSLVLGDLIAPGSSIFRQQGSEVGGQTITDPDNVDIPDIPDIPDLPDITIVPPPAQTQNPFVRGANFAVEQITSALLRLFQTFAFAALAALLIIFVPRQMERVADAIAAQPLVTGAVGFLSAIVGTILLVFLVVLALITLLLLSPLTLLVALVLVLALVFGLIAAGFEVGRRLAQSLDQAWAPPLQAGIGTFVLSLAIAASSIFWPLGVLAWLLVSSLGLGAVVMTRFGTQEYVGDSASVEAVEVIEPEPEPEVKPKRRTRSKKADKE